MTFKIIANNFNIVANDVRFQMRQNVANTKFQFRQIVGVGFTFIRSDTMSDVYILQKFDKREFVKNEILFTSEAIEILGISRSRMNMLLKKGQLEPIRRTTGVNLFLRDDIINKRDELIRKRKQYGYRND